MAVLCLLTNTPWPWPTPAGATSARGGVPHPERSGGRPQAGLHKRSAEDWGASCARQGRSTFHVFLQALRARIHTPRLFLSSGQLFLFFGSCRVGNRAAFSDSRSNFHT